MKPLASLAITASSCAAILAGMQQPTWLRVLAVGLGATGAVVGLALCQLTVTAILRAGQRGAHWLGDALGATASMLDDLAATFRARLAEERANRFSGPGKNEDASHHALPGPSLSGATQ